MATISLTNPVFYANGVAGASSVIGYESNQNRVCRFQFTAPNIGANRVSFTMAVYFGSGDRTREIRFLISDNGSSYTNAGEGTIYTGTVSFSEDTASGSANFLLMPGKIYYLWLFPGTSRFGWWGWNSTATLVTEGGAGIVYYDTGNEMTPCVPYYDNGSAWEQVVPYYDDGTAWHIIT